MSKFIKLQQVWIDPKNKKLCYDKVIVNTEQIECVEPDTIYTTSYPAVLNDLNVGDRSMYEKEIGRIECCQITLTSGKEITVADKFEEIENFFDTLPRPVDGFMELTNK